MVGKMARAIVAQQSASSDFRVLTTMKTNKPDEEKNGTDWRFAPRARRHSRAGNGTGLKHYRTCWV